VRLLPGSVAVGVLVAGCATHNIARVVPPTAPLRAVGVDEVISAYDAYCNGLETVSASGDLDVKDFRAGKERKLGVRLVARRGGLLYVKGSVLLATALEVVADGERFWFQVPSKKTVWTGRVGAEPVAEGAEKEPYYALRPRDVSAALLPEPLGSAAGEVVILEADREEVCLIVSRPADGHLQTTARQRVCLDRETLLPRSLRLYDERGDLGTEIALADVHGGAARRVGIARPREGYEASFVFERLVRNEPVPDKAFVPRTPEGYQVVEVGQ
jgi:outer membrane lipoprotein-sorting protein